MAHSRVNGGSALAMRSSIVAPVSGRQPVLEAAVDAPLELSLFGTLAARRNGQAVPLRLPQHAIRLLAYLLLNRERRQTREHIAFTLWPDDDEADARANLRRKLHLLLRALPAAREPWIVTSTTSVAWNSAAPYRLDVAEFETLSGVPQTLADADALYTGDLLVDLYDDWIVRERDRLRTVAMDNLLALVAHHQKRRDYSGAIRYAQRLRGLDPWREDAVRALITLRYEAGDRAGALTEYERFRAGVSEEMGVEPMPETVCVYERVLELAGTPAAAAAAADPGPSQRPRGLPFVARERELQMLATAWAAAADGSGSSNLIVGEAGIGKTRLIEEFASFVDHNGGRILRGGTTPFELTPYQPFSEALRSVLPILRETKIEPLWLAVLATLVPQMHVAFPDLRRLTPLDVEPERTRLFQAVETAVNALSTARPTLLILEDLHWAGSATVALLEHLARHAPSKRLLILASYREDELARTHPLRTLRRRLEREQLLRTIALGPLNTAAIEEIVGQLVDDEPGRRTAIARDLHDSSDGNPFFLSEVIADEREAGALDDIARRWQRRRASLDALPSLTSTLGARLDRLSARARSIAEVAAVIGRSFSAELVREVSGGDERSTLDSLEELVDRRLVREVDAAGTDFAFSHQLMQQTVYAAQAPEARQRRHRRVADVIEELYGEQLEQVAAELASHLDRGGESERAAEYYCLAGRHALSLFGSGEARTLASRAGELASESVTRFRAIEILEEAARRLGDRDAQRAFVAQLLALAEEIGDEELLREARRREIVLAHDCGERARERAGIAALEALTGEPRAPWPATFAQLKGSYLIAIGSYREARAVMAHALADISQHDYPRIYVECRCALVELAALEGRVADVQAFLDDVPAFESTHDVAQAVTLLETACQAASRIQDYAALGACAQRLGACSRAIGYREGEASAYAFAGRAALRLFEIDRARASLEQAAEMFESMGQRLKQLQTINELGNLTTTIGRFDEAIAHFEAAASIAASISYRFGQVACANNISYTAYLKGDFELARSAARSALEAAQTSEAPSAHAHALVSIGIAERELGELEAAIMHLEDGTALERRLNETVALGEDLCELIVALLRCARLDRARELAAEVLALAGGSTQQFSRPQNLLWAAAAVSHAAGDDGQATALLARARSALDELEAAIPDSESRSTFRRLRYHRAIDEAFDRDHWVI
jgi:DNA-binding SARP family transcriptional activator/tetratricopeptide (TPR) repeat protein